MNQDKKTGSWYKKFPDARHRLTTPAVKLKCQGHWGILFRGKKT